MSENANSYGTPRTDAAEKDAVNLGTHGWKFARQLERELAEMTEAMREWRDKCIEKKPSPTPESNPGMFHIPEANELADMAAKARRYDWLKKNATDIQWPEHHVRPATMYCLDAAIDVSARVGATHGDGSNG
jgi:hypothetical protein